MTPQDLIALAMNEAIRELQAEGDGGRMVDASAYDAPPRIEIRCQVTHQVLRVIRFRDSMTPDDNAPAYMIERPIRPFAVN